MTDYHVNFVKMLLASGDEINGTCWVANYISIRSSNFFALIRELGGRTMPKSPGQRILWKVVNILAWKNFTTFFAWTQKHRNEISSMTFFFLSTDIYSTPVIRELFFVDTVWWKILNPTKLLILISQCHWHWKWFHVYDATIWSFSLLQLVIC